MGAWFRPPRQVFAVFVGVAAVSAVSLGALAWQLLAQDRHLELQRRQIALESAADTLVAAMRESLADLESHLGAAARPDLPLPPDVVALTITGEDISARPGLLYYPIARLSSVPAALFENAERLEMRARDLTSAAAAYARHTADPNPEVRAEALMRLARVDRGRGATSAALNAYGDLDALGETPVADLPASLVAAYGRLKVYAQDQRRDDVRREAAAMLARLREGRWRVTEAQYSSFARDARDVLREAPAEDPAAAVPAEVAADLWRQRGAPRPATRRVMSLPSGTALVIWTSTTTQLDAVIAGQAHLASLGPERASGTKWALSHEGQPILGTSPPPGAPAAVRAAVTSGLPWTLHVSPAGAGTALVSPRRQLVWLILGLVTVVLLTGWYVIFRALQREHQVARLQSDFVAAVSHEFRSPLTSLTHAADLLVHDRLVSEGRRRQTYQVLVRDTARLRALVEGLLAFGRLEAGAAFQFEDTNLDAVVQSTVEDFREDSASHGHAVDLSFDAGHSRATVDREAVTRAIRNLLDNAVKYSPDARGIEVRVRREPGVTAIDVRDHGIGIPAEEQEAIFERFVRGAASAHRRIRGTGIGLAMVRQIARAHGGDVTVTSAPGDGSVFTLRLPENPPGNGHATERPAGLEVTQ